MHDKFQAMAQGKYDFTTEIIAVNTDDYGVLMTILTPEAAIYITKEQAMAFFNLVEAPQP